MENEAILFEIAKLELKPDDILIIRLPEGRDDVDDRVSAYSNFKNITAGLGIRFAVIPHDVDMFVINKQVVSHDWGSNSKRCARCIMLWLQNSRKG